MTFDQFQALTPTEKREIAIAHLAAVLRAQAPLNAAERRDLIARDDRRDTYFAG